MVTEIERKFLVKGDGWRFLAVGTLYRQGYISTNPERTVRVRLVENTGYLTIKGLSIGLSRAEFEYIIPVEEASQILQDLCERPLIEKTRYKINVGDLFWEVDEFEGENKGLILAEVELTDENQIVELPNWIGKEVSGDPRYFNSYLTKHPFSHW